MRATIGAQACKMSKGNFLPPTFRLMKSDTEILLLDTKEDEEGLDREGDPREGGRRFLARVIPSLFTRISTRRFI